MDLVAVGAMGGGSRTRLMAVITTVFSTHLGGIGEVKAPGVALERLTRLRRETTIFDVSKDTIDTTVAHIKIKMSKNKVDLHRQDQQPTEWSLSVLSGAQGLSIFKEDVVALNVKAVRPVAPLPPAGQPHPVAKEASMAEEVGQPLMKAMERGNNDDGR
uniref:Uncharacterized protein n=1 Tax=Oryza sativa subsp. japonica TaxID=39947 RepID=Q6ZKQ2_ORYSJ|nr:hypothetical protein [Oryza sativa Japonica Group]